MPKIVNSIKRSPFVERGRLLHRSAEATTITAISQPLKISQGARWSKTDQGSNKTLRKWKANPTRMIKIARRSRLRSS